MAGDINGQDHESHLEVVEVQDPKTWEWKKVLTEVQIRNVLEEWKPWNPDDQDVKVVDAIENPEVYDLVVFAGGSSDEDENENKNKKTKENSGQDVAINNYDPTEQGITDNNLIEADNLAAQRRLLDQGYGGDPSWTSLDVDHTFDVGGF